MSLNGLFHQLCISSSPSYLRLRGTGRSLIWQKILIHTLYKTYLNKLYCFKMMCSNWAVKVKAANDVQLTSRS
jgi:hypothetical protein